ncbi:hypothetical protein ACWD4G_40145 [Streptomyces sp. NPDC002643]
MHQARARALGTAKGSCERSSSATGTGVTVRGHRPHPPAQARGMWLALDHLHPGLVRDFGAEQLRIGAPECGSWVRVDLDGDGTCSVTQCGPRAIWPEIEETVEWWRAAGEPSSYRIEFDADGTQRAVARHGRTSCPGRLTTTAPSAT